MKAAVYFLFLLVRCYMLSIVMVQVFLGSLSWSPAQLLARVKVYRTYGVGAGGGGVKLKLMRCDAVRVPGMCKDKDSADEGWVGNKSKEYRLKLDGHRASETNRVARSV